MTRTALIDTNILIYSYDRNAQFRHQKAKVVLTGLYQHSAGYLSVKTISEFFAATRRLGNILSLEVAIAEMEKYVETWPVLDLTPAIAIEAARGVKAHQIGYWDAQMWATAKLNSIDAIFTENMHTGSILDGVEIINPLNPTFDLAGWLRFPP